MNNITLSTIILMIISIGIQAKNINTDSNSTTVNNNNEQIKVQSVREAVGSFDPLEHTDGQIRAGYITLSQDGQPRLSSYALGGHCHFNTKRWNGLMVGLSAYTVLNLGENQNKNSIDPDFFDENGDSFILFSKAFIDGKWGNTEIKFGRQALDTPHADSDDIRMMPNFFTAYTITNNDIENLTLTAGLITEMAGWENGINASRFVNISETLGTSEGTDGIYYASASYEGIRDLSLSLWYYNYQDIANVIYAEAGYNYELSKNTTLTFGVQYDGSRETGTALLGHQDAKTFGLSAEVEFKNTGITVLAAYNEDNGDTGATGLSLGGGPFFTSMEDQTLDAIGTAGKAWVMGADYDFGTLGIDDLAFGLAYGHFEADDRSMYESNEIDAVLEYTFNEKISLTAAYASVRFDAGLDENSAPLTDYDQFRFIANYSF